MRSLVFNFCKFTILASLLLRGGLTLAADEKKPVPEATDTDPKPGKLQNGLSGSEAAAAMSLPLGFKAVLCASEPEVMQPIAMCFDDRGRLWVAESYAYPHRQPEGKAKDQILIFEDTNGDHKFDKRTVFIDKLNLVSGLEVGFGGVWVGAAPNLMFIPDANGDDKPDGPVKILLDGWGYQDTHETLNSFIWGPDGWLYGCHGIFTHSNVGKPGTPDAKRTPINGGTWRYHPTRHEFERFCEGSSNPWGIDFNDRGHAFITACVIPHLYHVQQGARFIRQAGQSFNEYTYEEIDTIAKHRHWAGAEWNRPDYEKSKVAGGGHAHAGAMFYQGGAWPESYKDKLIMNNIHGARLNKDKITRNGEWGASYQGDFSPDFCYANDSWSQILYLRYGPDAQVTMIDWYDKQQCHDPRHPEVHDRSNGRIFKIIYGNPESVKAFDLKKLSSMELAKLMLNKNDWYVRQARRILQERAAAGQEDEKVLEYLVEQYSEQKETPTRLRFLWAIHAFAGKEGGPGLYSFLLKFMGYEENPDVRAWLIQLAAEKKDVPDEILKLYVDMAKNDKAPIVRGYLASALQRLPLKDRWPIAEVLVLHGEDAGDHNLPLMYWYGIEPLVMDDSARAMTLAKNCKIPKIAQFIVRRAAAEAKGYEALLTFLTSSQESEQKWILNEIVTSLHSRANVKMPAAWNDCYEKLSKLENDDIRQDIEFIGVKFSDPRVLPAIRKTLANGKAELRSRVAAIDALVAAKDSECPVILQKLLDEKKLRLLAINALAEFDHKNTPSSLIKHYSEFDLEEKQAAIATLTSRPKSILAMLDAMEAKQIPTSDLSAFTAVQIARGKNEQVAKRLKTVWGQIRETSSNVKEETEKYRKLLNNDAVFRADLQNGRLIFNKTCGTCHKLFGVGNTIGPELTGSNRQKSDYLLENILDPSASVGKDYLTTIISTKKGRDISGIIKEENETAVTLQTPTAIVKIDKADIQERELSKMSLMPEGQLKTITDQEVINLIAYLRFPNQVDLPSEEKSPASKDEKK